MITIRSQTYFLLSPLQAVKRFMNLECKCHGVSGSCSVRTCWLAMADFRRTGDHLRKKYNGAVQVAVNQYGTGFTAAHTHFKQPSKNDLVYFEDSPDYCIRDPESGQYPPFLFRRAALNPLFSLGKRLFGEHSLETSGDIWLKSYFRWV